MITKDTGLKLETKDIDQKQGIVSASVSIFGNVDHDRHMMMPGAYRKTLQENKSKIKHFLNHSQWQPVGIPRELSESDSTLDTVSKYMLKTDIGRNTFEYVVAATEEGVQVDHSVGINIVKSIEAKDDQGESYERLTEVRLHEFSTLTTWGANDQTGIINVKGAVTTQDIAHQIKIFSRVLKNDNLPHSRLLEIEKELNNLDAVLKSLLKPSIDTSLKPGAIEQIFGKTHNERSLITDLLN